MAGIENAVVVRFVEPGKAYQSPDVLKACAAAGRNGLETAVVERAPEGRLAQIARLGGEVTCRTPAEVMEELDAAEQAAACGSRRAERERRRTELTDFAERVDRSRKKLRAS